MKKVAMGFVGLTLGMILFSQTALAACDGGTEFTGKNGKTFCVSNFGLNWWSAFTWCESQGMQLASMSDLCDVNESERWYGQTGDGACPNIKGQGPNKTGWSNLTVGTDSAYFVNISTGSVTNFLRGLNYGAICH